MKKLKILSLLILLLVILVVVISNIKKPANIKAEKGILDLSQNKISENKGMPIQGTYFFYFGKFLSADDFNHITPSYINAPYLWNNQIINRGKLPDNGFATYRVKILLNKQDVGQTFSLSLNDICTSYKLFINGKEYMENGKIGENKNYAYPNLSSKIVTFTADKDELDLVIQVSNFSQKGSGIWGNIILYSGLGAYNNINILLLQFFIIGCIFIIGIYNINQYFLIRKDKSFLYFGLLCLSFTLRSLTTYGRDFLYNNLKLNFYSALKLEYISLPLVLLFSIIYFYSLFPSEFNKILYKVMVFTSMAWGVFTLLTPSTVYTYTVNVFIFISIIWFVVLFVVLYKAILNNRDGIIFFITGTIFLLLSAINDILVSKEIINSPFLMPLGILIFIIFQSIAVSERFSLAYKNLENYLNENKIMYNKILELNSSLEKKVEARTEELKNKNNQLSLMASLDSLTKIYNHGSILKILEEEIDSSIKSSRKLSVAMLDIDFFKHINDTYGHSFGDKIILSVVDCIKNNIRETDYLGRYGGEEFLIIFKNTPGETAFNICERIRKSIMEYSKEKYEIHLTISGGIAEYNKEFPNIIVEKADEMLYKAKESGRNTILKA